MRTRKWVAIGAGLGALFGIFWGANESSVEGIIFFMIFWAICGAVIVGINVAMYKEINWNSHKTPTITNTGTNTNLTWKGWLLLIGVLVLAIWLIGLDKFVELDMNDNGRRIELDKERYLGDGDWDREGQILVITLEANWTDGYTWKVAELDTDILRQKGETEFKRPESDTNGSRSIQIMRFKSVKKGETPLKLAYYSPQDSGPLRNFSIQVIVR